VHFVGLYCTMFAIITKIIL